jgi:hypothetical protein
MQEDKIVMAEHMRLHIEACQGSGMYVQEYCKLHNLKPSSYYYWRKKLIGTTKANTNTGSFIQLQPLPSGGCIEVVFANGVKIHFENLVPADYLKQLVS